MILHQSRFATPWSLLVWDRCFPYLNISEIPIQFIWERPEIEVLVLYLVVIDLHSRLGGIRPARCVKPALGGSPRPRFRPRLVSKGPDYSNALRCARTPVLCVKTTCRVRRRPLAKWTFNLVFIDLNNILRDKSQGRRRTRHVVLTQGTGVRAQRRAFE